MSERVLIDALHVIRTLHSPENLFEQCFVCDRPGPCETYLQAATALDA